jgi:recombinational DNA repair ATPase RecF
LHVERIDLRGFRNLADGELSLDPSLTVVHGPNGAGKTNLLEALYFGLTGRSCRTNAEREAIRFGDPLARVEVTVAEGGERRTFLSAVERGVAGGTFSTAPRRVRRARLIVPPSRCSCPTASR